jgi:hypothetical protein
MWRNWVIKDCKDGSWKRQDFIGLVLFNEYLFNNQYIAGNVLDMRENYKWKIEEATELYKEETDESNYYTLVKL